ncbi:histone H2A-Bbd type 1-like [Grammomys surdaster]|uniref:histone H2A-Bbd type 1-like n=1 Tax=Grammomys surdaster TaxID=491861 RepID=UPI00109FE25A|nr:histone H2A-Bbd type 1-like [Grammomys surdaster]
MDDKRLKARKACSSRAELQFSVSKVERALRKIYFSKRLNTSASVFLMGVLKYLTSNILDLAGKEARNSGNNVITQKHLIKAVLNNKELIQLFKDNKYLIDEIPGPSETPGPSEK